MTIIALNVMRNIKRKTTMSKNDNDAIKNLKHREAYVFEQEPTFIDGVEYFPHENGGGLVAATATVAESAYVGKDAKVYGDARVYGNAEVSGNTRVSGNTKEMKRTKIERVNYRTLSSIIEYYWEKFNNTRKEDGLSKISWCDYFRNNKEERTVSFRYKGENFTLEYTVDKKMYNERWYVDFEFPAQWEICHECRGEGRGLIEGLRGVDVTEMCQEDPDFFYDYAGGRYDTNCHRCGGSGKVLEIKMDHSVRSDLFSEVKHLEWESSQPCPIQEAERKMGA